MPPREVAPRLLSWASDVEPATVEQAARTARLPFVHGHVALMPDAHVGIGSTVGSVIPTSGAILPAAVGVDIGCGMVAAETNLLAKHLPDDLDRLFYLIEERVPAGVGKGHDSTDQWDVDLNRAMNRPPGLELDPALQATAVRQFGTLGSGNHFVEISLDERDRVWVVLHSGSRGVGNKLAQRHIEGARKLARAWFIPLEDPDLAYLVQGTREFDSYVYDVLWAQRYALGNRERMATAVLDALFAACGIGERTDLINCHHNYVEQEHHSGRDLWVTRKGAIRAREGDRGVIPGSMGTRSYIVSGRGVAASWTSCSHGAGRRMSRTEARKRLTVESLQTAMTGRTWNADKAAALLDEHPDSYKSIDVVMEDQRDLVTVEHELRAVLNYKGT